MGCKLSTVEESEEVYLPTIEFKSKLDTIIYKLKSIKERAQCKKDLKTVANADW